jgi:hypothetical protein
MKMLRARLGSLLLGAALAGGCFGSDPPATIGEAKATVKPTGTAIDDDRLLKQREDALAAARVWHLPPVPASEANLRDNPSGPGGFGSDDEVTCRFTTQPVGGTTPKFYCTLASGEVVKVKYGSNNPELRAEVAATRLLVALGFGADRVYVVGRVRCVGCPLFPFQALKCLQRTGLKSACLAGGINYERIVDFDTAVIERRIEGRKIEGVPDQGWAWFELDKIDPARGGSLPAEVDALRLTAVLLAHWDNKAENQRLVCLPGNDRDDGSCAGALAVMQDLGATFGPVKVDLNNWRKYRVWADGAISNEGRLLLLGWLEQLSDEQLRDLFEGSRVTQFDQFTAEARNAQSWVNAFKDKVRQIRDAGPCPTSSE